MKYKIPHPKELNLDDLLNSDKMVVIGIKVKGREKLKFAQAATSAGLTLTAYCADLLISSAKKVDALGNALLLKEQTINQLKDQIKNAKQAVVAAPEIIYGEAAVVNESEIIYGEDAVIKPEIKFDADDSNLKSTETNSIYAFFQGKIK